MTSQMSYREGGMVDKCTSAIAYANNVSLFVCGVALSVSTVIMILNDDDGAVVAINAFNVVAGLTFMASPIASFVIERENLARCRVSSEQELATRKEAARQRHEDDWKKESSYGQGLALREDLYGWSFVTCFHPDHLALHVFLGLRRAEVEKREKALEDGRELLKKVQKIDFSANEDVSARKDE